MRIWQLFGPVMTTMSGRRRVEPGDDDFGGGDQSYRNEVR
jgi:hypothetical protein